MKKGIKILIGTVCTAAIIAGGVVGIYLYVIPTVVSSSWVNKTICKEVKKFLDADLIIQNPKLATSFSPNIGFTLDEISLKKNKKEILNLKSLDTEFSFSNIFSKRIIVKKLWLKTFMQMFPSFLR